MDDRMLLSHGYSVQLHYHSSTTTTCKFASLPKPLQLLSRKISHTVFAVSAENESLQQSNLLVGVRPIERLQLSPYCRLVHSKTSGQRRVCRLCFKESQFEEEGVVTKIGFHGRTAESEVEIERESRSNRETKQSFGVTLAISLLRFYKREISPFLPRSCRYVPSCSEYAVQAYKTYGVLKGTVLTAWRLARCNPFGGSGFDPPRWFGESKPPS